MLWSQRCTSWRRRKPSPSPRMPPGFKKMHCRCREGSRVIKDLHKPSRRQHRGGFLPQLESLCEVEWALNADNFREVQHLLVGGRTTNSLSAVRRAHQSGDTANDLRSFLGDSCLQPLGAERRSRPKTCRRITKEVFSVDVGHDMVLGRTRSAHLPGSVFMVRCILPHWHSCKF